MEHVVHDHSSSNARQLFLVDSMSAALAFDRCRSKNFRMLRQIRRFCSFALARNMSFSVRWVPSELNPADGPSRGRPLTNEDNYIMGHKVVTSSINSPLSLAPANPHGTKTLGSPGASGCAPQKECQKNENPGAREVCCGQPSDQKSDLEGKAGADSSKLQLTESDLFVTGDPVAQPTKGSRRSLEFLFPCWPEGSEERKALVEAQQTPPEEVCGRGHGCFGQRPQSLGEEGDCCRSEWAVDDITRHGWIGPSQPISTIFS